MRGAGGGVGRAVALQYSGVVEGRPLPTVVEMEAGAVDRGAVIAELSQYPGTREREYGAGGSGTDGRVARMAL